jgi:hypothetical protein
VVGSGHEASQSTGSIAAGDHPPDGRERRGGEEMSANLERAAAAIPGALEPVAPSLVVRIVMRPMTRVLNPLIRKLAGRRHFRMAAQIRHVGRRSGRP